MARLNEYLDVSNLPNDEFMAIPDGTYTAIISAGDVKSTKSGDGSYISLTFKIRGGEYNDCSVVQNFNIVNPSAKATQIGKANLKKLLLAVNRERVSDTDELIGLICVINVVQKESNGYVNNEIKSYEKYADSQVPPYMQPTQGYTPPPVYNPPVQVSTPSVQGVTSAQQPPIQQGVQQGGYVPPVPTQAPWMVQQPK